MQENKDADQWEQQSKALNSRFKAFEAFESKAFNSV